MKLAYLFFTLLATVQAKDLGDIKHIVYFMQENRAFNHYYGTMAGVRGLKDPNVLQKDGSNRTVFYQPTGKDETPYLLPFYVSENKDYSESNQCLIGGSNEWTENHQAWNHGKIDAWVTNNTAYSWGYYKREDVPYHWEIVEGWTVADMYSESVIGPTCPNRATWISGTINAEGSPVGDFENNGGMFIENWLNDGCQTASDGSKFDCYPLKWKTINENLDDAGVDWFVYQQRDDFSDNPFQWWEQFQSSDENDELVKKGMSFVGMEGFYEQAKNGTLPPVSWVIGPIELSEHPPYRPVDGAWLHSELIKAVLEGPAYNETAILISYDETGGWGDHVPPFVSPEGTKGEWIKDPKNVADTVPTGPGFRVPFYVISPYTRGGHVFTEPADHNSQLLFLEEWVKARYNKTIVQETMNPWRREHMSNLVNMFDFDHPDYSIPKLSDVPEPRFVNGVSQSTTDCQNKWKSHKNGPPVPYGNQTEENALWTESGFKQVRGNLTEGRYLVIERNIDHNLSYNQTKPTLRATGGSSSGFHAEGGCQDYKCEDERFVLYQGKNSSGDVFAQDYYLKSYYSKAYLGKDVSATTDANSAIPLNIWYENGKGYVIAYQGQYLDFDSSSLIQPQFQSKKAYFNIYSVTY